MLRRREVQAGKGALGFFGNFQRGRGGGGGGGGVEQTLPRLRGRGGIQLPAIENTNHLKRETR